MAVALTQCPPLRGFETRFRHRTACGHRAGMGVGSAPYRPSSGASPCPKPPSAVTRPALVATLDLTAAKKHRAAFGFFRDRRPELYGRLTEDI